MKPEVLAYKRNKQSDVGDQCECPVCGEKFFKRQYSQAFCCGKCKDRYHNEHTPGRSARKPFQSVVECMVGQHIGCLDLRIGEETISIRDVCLSEDFPKGVAVKATITIKVSPEDIPTK